MIVALALLLIFFPWNALRGPISRLASERLERQVSIDGDLRVHLGFTPRIEVGDVTVGNAAWSDLQPMVHVTQMNLRLSLLSLIWHPIRIPEIELVEPRVVLEKNAEGDANWQFGKSEGSSGGVSIGTIRIDRGTFRFRNPGLTIDVAGTISSSAEPDGKDALSLQAKGTYRGEAFTLDGKGLGLAALRNVDDPYQLTVHARAGATDVRFDGSVIPASPQSVDGRISLQGKDLSSLHPIVPATLPWTPPYKVSGQLVHEGGVWSLRDIKGLIGQSDINGTAQVDVSKPRPKVGADLVSKQMHYEDLGGFVGIPPGATVTPAHTTEQKREAARREASTRLLSDKPINVAGLRAFDADVKFRGTNVRVANAPIDNLRSHLVITDGVMTLDPLDFGVADGHVVSRFAVDVSSELPTAQGSVEVRNVELKRLFPQLQSPRGSAGRFGGFTRFKTQGASIAALVGQADGDGALIMRGGEASTLALVLTNLDLARATQLLLRGDTNAEIRCAVASYDIEKGVLEPRLMVVDTSAVTITGTGSVSLREEQYDLHLKASAKKPSLVALRGPIVIGGSFKTPSVRPEMVPLLTRIGAAVGLGAVTPPLALLALVDFGGASDVDCRQLMIDAQHTSVGAATATRIAK